MTYRLALLALAFAQPLAAQTLQGPAAFGDWHDSRPGVRHRITPQDLPPPYATRSASDSPREVPRPPGAMPEAPPGWTVTLIASHLRAPRTLHPAPGGGMLLAEFGAGRVLLLHQNGQSETLLSGLDLPYGLALYPPQGPARYLYVAETNRVIRVPLAPGTLHVTGPAETIIPNLPQGGHVTRDIAFSPGGARLYVSIGSDANIAARPEPGRAEIRVYDPDGHGGRPLAQGLRNPVSLAILPDGTLWTTVNERDGLGDNLPPDYVTHVSDGGQYGWPYFYIGPHPDPRVHNPPPGLRDQVIVPDLLIQPHSAPLGIALYPPTGPLTAWRGSLLVALHGSWNRTQRTGYKLIRIPLDGNHAPGWYEDVLTGFVVNNNQVWGRPTGVAVAADGAIWLSEDANGTVWRATPPG